MALNGVVESMSPKGKSKTKTFGYLEVCSGIHRGVRLPLDAKECLIGKSSQVDVELQDPSIAEEHVRLRFHARLVAVEALGDDVYVNGIHLAAGHGKRLPMSFKLEMGDVELSVVDSRTRPVAGWFDRCVSKLNLSVERKSTTRAFIAIASVLIVALGAFQVIDASPLGSSGKPKASQSETKTADTSTPQESAATGFDHYLSQHGFSGVKAIQNDGRVIVVGNIAEDKQRDWSEARQWFDLHYGDQVVLSDGVKSNTQATPPALQLQAVWFGDSPYVIDSIGRHLYPGSSVGDGWVLSRIDGKGLVFKRDGHDFAMTY